MARMDQLDKVIRADCTDQNYNNKIFANSVDQVEKEVVSCLHTAGSALSEVAKDKPSQKQVCTCTSSCTCLSTSTSTSTCTCTCTRWTCWSPSS